MGQQVHKKTAIQWGIACGLLMFSLVTLCGIAVRIEPFVIAQRALVCAVVMGMVVQFAIRATGLAFMKKRKTWLR